MKKINLNIKIRRAGKKNLGKVIDIIKNSYHKRYAAAGEFYSVQQFNDPNYATENGPYYSLKTFIDNMISDLDKKLKKPFEFFVAEKNKEIVAFLIIEKNKKAFWINNMMVKKESQRKGIGKNLLEFASKNKKPLYLWVNSKNPAKHFWSKLGFKKILQETLMIKK